jgi:hypothetical protein
VCVCHTVLTVNWLVEILIPLRCVCFSNGACGELAGLSYWHWKVVCVMQCLQWTDWQNSWFWHVLHVIWWKNRSDWLSYLCWYAVRVILCLQWTDWLSCWYKYVVHLILCEDWNDLTNFLILIICVCHTVLAVNWLAEVMILISCVYHAERAFNWMAEILTFLCCVCVISSVQWSDWLSYCYWKFTSHAVCAENWLGRLLIWKNSLFQYKK